MFERTLLREFRSENEDEYRKFLGMTAENFHELLDLIDILKTYSFPQSTNKFLYQLNALVVKRTKEKVERKLDKSNFFAQ